MQRAVLALSLLHTGCLFVLPVDRRLVLDADQDGSSAEHDCNDSDPAVGPDMPERCNGIDDDCNGEVDEGLSPDDDGDGFGDLSRAAGPCRIGWSPVGGDCDDADPLRYPGAAERCDGEDNGCVPGWDAMDEIGSVTWSPADGPPVSVPPLEQAGADEQVVYEIPGDGRLTFCGREVPYAVALQTPGAFFEIIVEGVEIEADGARFEPVLAGGSEQRILTAEPDEVGLGALTVRHLSLVGARLPGLGGPALRAEGVELVDLEHLQISGHQGGADGGAVALHDSQVATLSHVRITDSETTAGRGGGLFASAVDQLRIWDSEISGNLARSGGGLGAVADDGLRHELTVVRSRIEDNVADGLGGGIEVQGRVRTHLTDTLVAGNIAEIGGGVVSTDWLTCRRVSEAPAGMMRNEARSHGGGIHLRKMVGSTWLSSSGCRHTDNRAGWPGDAHADLSMPEADGEGMRYFDLTGLYAFCQLGSEGVEDLGCISAVPWPGGG